MKNKTHNKSRRAILKGLVAIPVVAIAGFQSTSSFAAMLSTDDPTAKALGYTEKSTTKGQTCSNCSLYKGDAAAGTCTIFPGKQVAGPGWCKSWAAK